ncbi:MAG: hypothetical protein KDD06_05945 [Phaeodactylibacter sp.]|nr:hypothetical protein [Phaeodactylibacter sp.]MCB9288136.1 hypothetical protein [Lewinellaceae bacterium]
MKYFILYHSPDHKEIGSAFPQAKSLYSKHFVYAPLSPYQKKKVPNEFRFPEYKLEGKAKLTDLLSSSTLGLPINVLVSPKFLKILENFTSPGFQTLEAKVLDKKGNTLPYQIIHQYQQMNHYVDYSKTILELTTYDFTVSPPASTKKEFQAKNFAELEATIQSAKGSFCVKNFHLREEIIQFDHFALIFPNVWIVNNKLAEALKASNITGICLIPLHPGENFCKESLPKKALASKHILNNE